MMDLLLLVTALFATSNHIITGHLTVTDDKSADVVLQGQLMRKLALAQTQLLGEKFDRLFNETVVRLHEKLDRQSRVQQILALCSLIPRPSVDHATQSIEQTSKETIITYTCHAGFAFSDGLTTRSTTCDGASWTPIDGNCMMPPCRPVLAHVIQGDRTVLALASFNNQLFVTRSNSSTIAVYDTTTFAWIRDIAVPGAGTTLLGLAPCLTDNCLYVSDDNNQVLKLDLSPTADSHTAVITNSWPVSSEPRGLSVKRNHNLLVAFKGSKKITEYTPNGSLVREILDSNVLWHAVEHVVNGTFVFSRWGPVHGVSLMSVDGQVIHSYGTTSRRSGPGHMDTPQCLAVDREGFVFVADWNNNRILVLNPTLSDARPLPLPTDASGQPLNGPDGLWLDESRGRLYVGEWNDSTHRVLIYDNVNNIRSLFIKRNHASPTSRFT